MFTPSLRISGGSEKQPHFMGFKSWDDDEDFDCIINDDFTIDPQKAFKVAAYSEIKIGLGRNDSGVAYSYRITLSKAHQDNTPPPLPDFSTTWKWSKTDKKIK